MLRDDLSSVLRSLQGKAYGAYKQLLSTRWKLGEFCIEFNYVQSDAFAPPSQFTLTLPQEHADFPLHVFLEPARNVACCDYINREIYRNIGFTNSNINADNAKSWHSEKGYFSILAPSQFVLPRTSVSISRSSVKAIFSILLPARGRSISGGLALRLLCHDLVTVVEKSMYFCSLDKKALWRHILCVEDQEDLRAQLESEGYIAFVANGSILPRRTGYSDGPMVQVQGGPPVLAFEAPPSLTRTFPLKNSGKVTGMVLQRGIHLIVGGGFHGKSTLLEALQVGVYNKIPGDGREFVICDATSVKIQAENHRVVTSVDITSFMDKLPFSKSLEDFSTQDASGSTSQASSIIESIELGAKVLMFDEDTCSSNFLFRDISMRALVDDKDEPIKTLISRGLAMYKDFGVSIVLVAGSCGDWFDIAHTVLQMKDYLPYDVTEKAKNIKRNFPVEMIEMLNKMLKPNEEEDSFGVQYNRIVRIGRLSDHRAPKTMQNRIDFENDSIDLTGIEQLVEHSQVVAISEAIQFMSRNGLSAASNRTLSLKQLLDNLVSFMWSEQEDGYRGIHRMAMLPTRQGLMSYPRLIEIGACINRMRHLKVIGRNPRE